MQTIVMVLMVTMLKLKNLVSVLARLILMKELQHLWRNGKLILENKVEFNKEISRADCHLWVTNNCWKTAELFFSPTLYIARKI